MAEDFLVGPAHVRNRFDGRWANGFQVVDAVAAEHGLRYKVVRCSDGAVLPVMFSSRDVRPEFGR